MRLFTRFMRQIKEKRDISFYRRRYNELSKELEVLQVFVNNKLLNMEKALDERIADLEKRIEELENYRRKTEHLVKIVDSLEPEARRN